MVKSFNPVTVVGLQESLLKLVSVNFFVMYKTRKIRCWACGSLDVIKWEKQNGKQHYQCKNCGIYLTRNNKSTSQRNRFVWFLEWIEGKQTFFQLTRKTGYSQRTLKRYFYSYLESFPQWKMKTLRES